MTASERVDKIFQRQMPVAAKLLALAVSRYYYKDGQPVRRGTITKLAKRAGIGRTSTYRAIAYLDKHGLMQWITVNGVDVILFTGEWA